MGPVDFDSIVSDYICKSSLLVPVVFDSTLESSQDCHSCRQALSPSYILRNTNAFSKKYVSGCSMGEFALDRKEGTFTCEVTCNEPWSEGPWEVKGYWDASKINDRLVRGKSPQLRVFLSCGCPAWVWWSAEYWAYRKQYLNPPVRGKIKPPQQLLKLRNGYYVCKHGYIALKSILEEVLTLPEIIRWAKQKSGDLAGTGKNFDYYIDKFGMRYELLVMPKKRPVGPLEPLYKEKFTSIDKAKKKAELVESGSFEIEE